MRRSDKKSPELKWHSASVRPRQNTTIVFDWCGERFTGVYVDCFKPWGSAWYIHARYFTISAYTRLIRVNQIERWAYADGS